MKYCKDCAGYGLGECSGACLNDPACEDFELKPKRIDCAEIARLAEKMRLLCEEIYNGEKPVQYAEMAQIEKLCDEIMRELE